ncbi:MAG: HPr family phosphocarrier protein [Litorimonas sp.]
MRFFDRVKSITTRLTLQNKRGLHARASNKFMECVSAYNSLVVVQSHNDVCEEAVEADSVMELLLLGAACGEDITITATGEDAQAAIAALTDLVNAKFGETE